MIQIVWPLIKLSCMTVLYQVLKQVIELSFWPNMLICFLVIWFYQDVVAKVNGLKRMSSMDAQCFVSSSKSHVNFISVCAYDRSLNWDILMFNIDRLIKYQQKMSYKVVECGGDYYYKALPME